MSHKLFRLMDSIVNTPHFITQSALQPIVEYIQNRSNNPTFAIVPDTMKPEEPTPPAIVGSVGELLIDGPITYRPQMSICGPSGTSYQGVLEDAAELIESGVSTIVMVHSSPGGQAGHCFSTAIELRGMADEAGVKLISYIDEMSASASLALGIVADEIIIHPEASTGSIGCCICLYDQSKAMANAGVKPIYISSTPGKTPFDASGEFSSGFLSDLQDDVSRLGMQFAEHVSKFSGIPLDSIVAMDAKMFHADAALEAGLVNKIMDHKQFAAYLQETSKGK